MNHKHSKIRIFNQKFESVKQISSGAYGKVYKVSLLSEQLLKPSEKTYLAIKKMSVENSNEGINFSALREIVILKEIKHENLLLLLDVCYDQENLFLVYEFLEMDLYSAITSRDIIFTEPLIKGIIQQILRGLLVLHENGILHRDLKPQNILVSKEGYIKLADFGFARFISSPNIGMTRNIVTEWYRAPELFFGAGYYSTAVDIWSVGCILAELIQRYPLFNGNGDIEILTKIFSVLGVPNESNWPNNIELPSFKIFTEGTVVGIKNKFNYMSPETGDLLEKMLEMNPLKRISAREALNHSYFKVVPLPAETTDIVQDLHIRKNAQV